MALADIVDSGLAQQLFIVLLRKSPRLLASRVQLSEIHFFKTIDILIVKFS